MAVAQQVVDLARTLRSTAHLKTRQPLATAWIALPDRGLTIGPDLLGLIAGEINVKRVEVIADDSALVERRVKPLLPRIGKRLGSAIPAVMAAARDGDVHFESDGSVTLAGVTLAPDEVEIQATPRPGTAVAHHDGLVVVLDTELTPELLAEGDARELARAIQDLRREAALELDDRIDLWLRPLPDGVAAHLPAIAADTLADIAAGDPPPRRVHRRGRARRLPGHDRAPASSGRRRERSRRVGEAGGDRRHDDRPTRSPAHWLVFSSVAVAVMIVDQLTKAWLVANVSAGDVVNVIGDYVRLIFSQNSGALFGMFSQNAVIFGIASLVVVGLIVGVPRPVRAEPLPVDRARAAARRRARQPHRPAAARLRRRLRRYRHRRLPLLHVQHGRRRHQHRDRHAHRRGRSSRRSIGWRERRSDG